MFCEAIATTHSRPISSHLTWLPPAGFLAVDQQQRLVRQGMGQAGLGNRHRESAEQCVGQRHGRAAAQAAVEGLERGVDAQATGQTAHQGADDHGDDHMHAGQAEHQHGADRGDDCVNHGYLKQKHKIQACPRPDGHGAASVQA